MRGRILVVSCYLSIDAPRSYKPFVGLGPRESCHPSTDATPVTKVPTALVSLALHVFPALKAHNQRPTGSYSNLFPAKMDASVDRG